MSLTPAALAERYYRLVERHTPPGMTIVPWDKLPAAHRRAFIDAAAALLHGE